MRILECLAHSALVRNTREYLDEGGIKSLTCLTASFALHFFSFSLAFPLYGFTAGFFLTTLSVSCFKRYPVVILSQPMKKIQAFAEKYPYVRVIALIFAWIICSYFPLFSLALGFVSGLLSGVTLLAKETRAKNIARSVQTN